LLIFDTIKLIKVLATSREYLNLGGIMEKKMLKTRTRFSNSLRNDLHEELHKLSSVSDIPVSKLLDRAVEMLLTDFEYLPKKSPDKE
jgi:hypothetical protein